MPDSSSELRGFEGVFRLLLMLFDGSQLAEISGQQLKLLTAVAVYQAIEDRRHWTTTVTGLEQLLGVSSKTIKRALKDLVDRRLLTVEHGGRKRYRSAKPLKLAVNVDVVKRSDWPDLSWDDVDRLSKQTFNRLQQRYDPSTVLKGGFVLGQGK